MNRRPGSGRRSAPVGVLCRVVRGGCEADGDLELDRVGVLELVEEDALVPVVQHPADAGLRGDEAPGEHEQVVELERALGRPLRGRFEHPAPEHRAEHLDTAIAYLLEQRRAPRRRTPAGWRARWRGPRGRGRPASTSPSSRSSSSSDTGLRVRRGVGRGHPRPCSRASCVGEPTAGAASRSAWLSSSGTGVSHRDEHPPEERCRHRGPTGPGRRESTRVFDEVPVLVERRRDPPAADLDPEVVELAELDEFAAAVDDASRGRRVVEQSVEQRFPAFFEGQMALEFVEHGEPGRKAGRHRQVVEQSSGECVQGADRSVVESRQRRRVRRRRSARFGAGAGVRRPPSR